MKNNPQDSVDYAATAVGDRWSLLLVREAFRGTRRFGEFRSALGISRNVLTARLKTLVEHGVFMRTPYRDQPVRYEYRLTDSGMALLPILLTMLHWGDTRRDDGQLPTTLIHRSCGFSGVHAEVVCSHCRDTMAIDDLRIRAEATQGSHPGGVSDQDDSSLYVSIEILPRI